LLLDIHEFVIHFSLCVEVDVVEEEHQVLDDIEALVCCFHECLEVLDGEVLLRFAFSGVVLVLADDTHELEEPVEVVEFGWDDDSSLRCAGIDFFLEFLDFGREFI
jgi:hypothetical protein